MPNHRHRFTARRRWAAAIGVAGAIAAMSVVTSTNASAAISFATTTKVTSASAWVAVGQPEKFTAKVSLNKAVKSLGITPTGNVVFTTGTQTLGTGRLGACILVSCTASITTTALPQGEDDVVASYAGDGVSLPSSADTIVNVEVALASSSKTCPPGVNCTTTTPYTDPGDGSVINSTLTTHPSGQTHTLNVALLTNNYVYECFVSPGNADDDLPRVDFGDSATDDTKQLTYDVKNADAEGLYLDFQSFVNKSVTPPMGCYTSTTPFNGWQQANCDCDAAVYGPAGSFSPGEEDPQTFYQAPLWPCSQTTPTANIPPCYLPPTITFNGDHLATEFKVVLLIPKTDPSYGPR